MWFNKFVPVDISNIGGGSGGSSQSGLTLNPTSPNTEYIVPNYTFNGKQVYYQLVGKKTRISTTEYVVASNVDRLISQCLCFQGYNSKNQLSGDINYFPYIHTNGAIIVLKMNDTNDLQIVVQSGSFAGNYLIAGWIFYTKTS